MAYSFAWVSCEKRDRDWDAAQILAHGIDFFVSLGDTPYCNQGFAATWGSTTTPVAYDSLEADFTDHYTQSQNNPAWIAMRSAVRTYHVWDDWEFGFNSWDWDKDQINAAFPAGDLRTQFSTQAEVNALGIEARKAYVSARATYFDNPPSKNPDGTTPAGEIPSGALQDGESPSVSDFPPLYSYELVNANGDVVTEDSHDIADIIIYLDCMEHCSPNDDPDNASKTRLGSVQKSWLFNLFDIFTGQVNFFHIFSSKKTRTANGDNADTWQGYSTELAEILGYIENNNIATTVWYSGDSHQPSVNTAETLGFTDHGCFNSSPIGGVLNGATENADNFWVSNAISNSSSQQGNTYGVAQVDNKNLTITYYRRVDGTPTIQAKYVAGSNALYEFTVLQPEIADPDKYMAGQGTAGLKDLDKTAPTTTVAKGNSISTGVFSPTQSGYYNKFYINAAPLAGPGYDRAFITIRLKQNGVVIVSTRVQLPAFVESTAQEIFYAPVELIALSKDVQYSIDVGVEESDVSIAQTSDYAVWMESEEQAMSYFGYPESTAVTTAVLQNIEWTGVVNTIGNTDEGWTGAGGAEIGLKFPTLTSDARLTTIKFRASTLAISEITFRVYASTEVSGQLRPTGSELGEWAYSVPDTGGVVTDFTVPINLIIAADIGSPVVPQLVAYTSGGATINICNDAAAFAAAPETLTAARSTDGLTGATWGNAGMGKQHVMGVYYSFTSGDGVMKGAVGDSTTTPARDNGGDVAITPVGGVSSSIIGACPNEAYSEGPIMTEYAGGRPTTMAADHVFRYIGGGASTANETGSPSGPDTEVTHEARIYDAETDTFGTKAIRQVLANDSADPYAPGAAVAPSTFLNDTNPEEDVEAGEGVFGVEP